MSKLSLVDRLGSSFLGALFGAVYGALLGLLVVWFTSSAWSVSYVESGAIVFGVLSFVAGPFIADVIAAFVHVFLGFLSALLAYETKSVPIDGEGASGLVKGLIWFSLGTAVAIHFGARLAEA
jgi:NhaP-type Na+/H+ or K+/H+ antiporter